MRNDFKSISVNWSQLLVIAGIFSLLLNSCASVKGLDNNERLSPFGKLVLTDGNAIYEINLKKEMEKQVLYRGSGISEVEWLPDGNRFIFSQRQNDRENLYLFDLSKMKAEHILTTFSAHSFVPSPNGEKLLFSDIASFSEYHSGHAVVGRANYDLFIFDFATGSVHKLVDQTPMDSMDLFNAREIGAWSPNGNKIAFYKRRMMSSDMIQNPRKWGIYTSLADGSNPELIVQGEYAFSDYYLSWPAQSNSLVIGTFIPIPWDEPRLKKMNLSSSTGIWRVNMENEKLEQIKKNDASKLWGGYTNFKNVCISPEGDHMIYSKKNKVYFVNLTTKTYRIILGYQKNINFDWQVE